MRERWVKSIPCILKNSIADIFELHAGQSRGHDKNIPYAVHPILGSMMILEDSKGIPETQNRIFLQKCFLYHDVFEDTTKEPESISDEVRDFVLTYLTNKGGSKAEYEDLVDRIKDIPWEAFYIKSIDKYINLINDNYFRNKSEEALKQYLSYLYFYYSTAMKKNEKLIDSFWMNQIANYLKERGL